MNEILNSPIIKIIGLTLFHSLWQAGLVYLIYKVIVSLFRSQDSKFRYGIGLMALAVLLLSNIITLSLLLAQGSQTSQIIEPLYNLSFTQLASNEGSQVANSWSYLESFIPAFIVFWWLGLLVFTVRFALLMFRTNRLTKTGLISPPEKILAIFKSLKFSLGMSEKVRIALSENVLTPVVAGAIKPIILLPIGLVNNLSTEEVEAILIHEFTHIRRHDYLVNIMQALIEMVYFFNPIIWLISNEIREERENICDDKAISMGMSRRAYADTLANVYEYAFNNNYALAFANRKKLTLKRIRRIMKAESNNNRLFSSLALVLAITLAIYLGAESHAPSVKTPFYTPERIMVASPLSALEFENPSELIRNLKLKLDKSLVLNEPLHQLDTIDEKELEKKAKEYEEVKERLHSTAEWKELEAIRAEMHKEQVQYLKELTPQIKETLKEVKLSVQLDEVELQEVRERMAQIETELEEIEITEEIEMVLEQSTRIMEESMAQVEAQMERIRSSEFEQLAQKYAKEAKEYAMEAEVLAKEAEKVAAEAMKEAKKVEKFLIELKPQLIKDGYIENEDELNNLRFKDEKVFVNDKEVKAKDAKKYYELRKKHLGTDTDIYIN